MPKISKKNLITRPPVVVVLGHIDHGKCIAPKTLIPLTNGEILNIEQIWKQYTQNTDRKYIKEGEKESWIARPKKFKVFSFNGTKVVTQPVQYIWKLKAPSNLIKVILGSGDEIVVTPEHPFFIFTSSGKIEQKKADLLKQGEFVVTPQKLNFLTLTAELKERIVQKLSNLNNFVIFLKQETKSKFFSSLKKVNKQDLYRKKLFSTDPSEAIRRKRFRARDFVKIGQYLGFSMVELYNLIDSIKNATEKWRAGKTSTKIKLPEMPKDMGKLGYIIGCLTGDGQTPNGIFHNSTPEIQSTFQKYIKEVFNLDTRLIKTKSSWKIISSGYKTFTRILTDIFDFPRYKKSKKIIFPQIFFGSLPFIQGFIAGWFDTDGYVSPINYSIEFTSKSKDLVKEVSVLLLYFGIHSAIYGQKKKGPGFKKKKTYYYLRIASDPYLKRFLNCFPIKHKEKKERIKTAITKSSVSRIFDLTPISGQNLYSFYINERYLPYFTQHRKYKFLSRYFLQKFLRWENKTLLPKIFLESAVKNLINPGEISCIKVKKIESLKNKYKFVYDLTVPNLHNFVAERIFIHNTALLDQIRKSHVAEKEAGGITQHIGAYQIVEGDKKITFIDTPGHEAFSAMRSRGSKVADLAILVVDCSEGVKAQTKEAISHIKKSGIPMIVALNKIDKPEANPEKVKKELTQEDVVVESLGGKTPSIEISALTGQGIPELLELILLVAEMENLKGELTKKAEGVVIESYLDRLRGPTATLLITEGVLKQSDILGTSSTFGKIKKLENFQGRPIEKAQPSDPAIVIGLEDVPKVGENFKVFPDLEMAKSHLKITEKKALEVLEISSDQKVLNLILKTDVLGSIEALEEVLNNLPQERVILRILKSEVGEVNENDIKLAKGGRALILGFRVKINPTAKILAEREKIKIMTFDVIYDLVEGVRKFMERGLQPEIVRTDLGKVKTLVIFLTEKNRQIIGGKVIEGEVKKGALIEIFRKEELVGKGKLVNLQKNKKDIDRAPKGEECGILYEGDTKIEEGDILVIYEITHSKG